MKQKTITQWIICTLAVYGAFIVACDAYFAVGSELLCMEKIEYVPYLYLDQAQKDACHYRVHGTYLQD